MRKTLFLRTNQPYTTTGWRQVLLFSSSRQTLSANCHHHSIPSFSELWYCGGRPSRFRSSRRIGMESKKKVIIPSLKIFILSRTSAVQVNPDGTSCLHKICSCRFLFHSTQLETASAQQPTQKLIFHVVRKLSISNFPRSDLIEKLTNLIKF